MKEAAPPRLRLVEGDITRLAVDAIVNAANERLLGGGGVDGAIHRAAGPRLLACCRALPEARPGVRCPTGEARLTPGFDLPARFVIHTVGPVWRGGRAGEEELLAGCYRNCLRLARDNEVSSLAFPALSCGVYGYPPRRAAAVAVRECAAFLAENRRPAEVLLVAFGAEIRAALAAALAGDERNSPGSANGRKNCAGNCLPPRDRQRPGKTAGQA